MPPIDAPTPIDAPFELLTIPCLSDNYAFVLANTQTGEATLFDVPEAAPINAALQARDWTLTTVVLTHHHWDHIDGLSDLNTNGTPAIIGAAADAHRLPPLTHQVKDRDTVTICGTDAHIFDVSGHTLGHIAIHIPAAKVLVTGDSLMALGCGRLFEGTPEQMWTSLQKLRDLPGDTRVCSGHEYTETNLGFVESLNEPLPALTERAAAIRAARAAGRPTVPSLLSEECATNPFLRADTPALARALSTEGQSPLSTFTEARERRNSW